MTGHNLTTVTSFEFLRAIRKKTFWIGTLGVPVIIAAVMALMILSQSATGRSADGQKDASITFTYTDASGLISSQLAAQYGGSPAADADAAREDVRAGRTQAFFAIPADPAHDPVQIHARDLGLFESGAYSAVAGQMITEAARDEIGSPELASLAAGGAGFSETLYADGEATGGIFAVVPPLLFLALFYGTVVFMGSQILNSTIEEKENRVTEMILTTLNPTTLITGKILALLMTGLVQVSVFVLPAAAGWFFLGGSTGPAGQLVEMMDPQPAAMATGAVLMVSGFLLFTGTLMAIGAVMPTAKEASGLFSAVVIIVFVPLYAASLFVSDPDSAAVQFFLYFPFSAPVAAMLLNGFGTLTAVQAAVVTVEVLVTGALMLAAAVKLFRHGSIRYSSKVSLKELYRRA